MQHYAACYRLWVTPWLTEKSKIWHLCYILHLLIMSGILKVGVFFATMILYFFYLLLSTGKECPMFDPPQNGALACNKIGVEYLCAAMCQNDFDFTFNPPLLYFCSSGQWHFYGIGLPYSTQLPWPNCSSKFVAKGLTWSFRGI